jgi:DMSO/TMAO reductase YedYZ molybdopterin-dependent catalytic subunit
MGEINRTLLNIPKKMINRREFLKEAGIVLGSAALASIVSGNGCLKSPDVTTAITDTISQVNGVIYSPDTLRVNRLPPGQREVSDWPQIQINGVPPIDLDKWSFTISGQVDNVLTLNYRGFTALKTTKVFSDIHCVTTWTRLNNLWEGVSAQTITSLVKLKPQARFVVVNATGGFTTNIELSDFLKQDVLFAMKRDDLPLSVEHGGPVRLVVPRLYFWKSAKWITGIEFTAEDHPGFWERAGYNNHGDPWKEERYS